MASNTINLNLLKKDPLTDGNDTFNIKTMLNDNWDKIDEFAGETIPISRGGTGATTAAQALANLGGIAVGAVGNLHVWERVQTYAEEVPAGYTLGELQENVLVFTENNTDKLSELYYADSISVDEYGIVSLVSPSKYAFYANGNYSPGSHAKGKFFYIIPNTGSTAIDGIWFLPSDSNLNRNNNQYFAPTIQKVTGYASIPAGTTTDYLTSTDRNAYPDNVTDAQDAYYTLGDESQNVMIAGENYQSYADCALFYSDSVSVNDIGDVSLNNPSSAVYKMSEWPSNFGILAGKFVRDQDNPSTIYYLPADVSIINNSGLVATKSQRVTGHAAIPANTTITYLGQLGGRARIEVVSYVGTGTYGQSNPCSVTADFPIKVLLVVGLSMQATYNFAMVASKLTESYAKDKGFIVNQNSGYGNYGKKSSDGKTFYWYNAKMASAGLNESGVTYTFIAIG